MIKLGFVVCDVCIVKKMIEYNVLVQLNFIFFVLFVLSDLISLIVGSFCDEV